MGNAITKPFFGPNDEQNIVVCVKKTGNYPIDQEIVVDRSALLVFTQDGEYVGKRKVYAEDKTYILNKKNVIKYPDIGKKLSSGLFSKEYKNVTVFWFLDYKEAIRATDTVRTDKGAAGKYDLTLIMDCWDLNHENFLHMLRETKIQTDRDKIIISKDTVRDIVRNHIKHAMATILDGLPGHVLDGSKRPYPSDVQTLCAYLHSEMLKIGLDAKFTPFN